MRYAKFLSDLTQVTFPPGLVLHNRSPALDFQIRDPRRVGENFVLPPSVKNPLSGSRLRFSKGSTADEVVSAGDTRSWKRESFRSGSNIGSSRSRAGVNGAAVSVTAGTDSSFRKAAVARSGSPICAATRAKVS